MESLDLEAELARLRATVADPRAGVFGPRSRVWELGRHSIVFLGAGRAALLQLAHPWVAAAIDEHSRTRADPIGRFHRTFLRVFDMVYGDLDAACAAARRVHAVHAGIEGTLDEDLGRFRRGSAYRAADLDALIWVHATLIDTTVLMNELVRAPLPADEKERYYAETRRFAALFAIPGEALPPDWAAFRRYFDDMLASDSLAVGRAASEIARFLFRPARGLPAAPLAPLGAWYRRVTAALLPERLRAAYGLRLGPNDRRMVAASVALLRRTHRYWPARVRYLPAYVDARRRLDGLEPDAVSALVRRVMVGRVAPADSRR